MKRDFELIHHYTSIENLALILKSQNIRCSRLDQLDDIEETQLYGDNNFYKFIFVSCWTKQSEEHIPFWEMYSNGFKGVRISLPLNFLDYQEYPTKSYRIEEDGTKTEFDTSFVSAIPNGVHFTPDYSIAHSNFGDFPIFKEVSYYKQPMNFFESDIDFVDGSYIRFSGMEFGLIKNKFWSFQEEIRIKMIIFPGGNSDEERHKSTNSVMKGDSDFNLLFFDLPISSKKLNSMLITLGPKCGEGEKAIVESLVSKYALNALIKDSELKGLIR